MKISGKFKLKQTRPLGGVMVTRFGDLLTEVLTDFLTDGQRVIVD